MLSNVLFKKWCPFCGRTRSYEGLVVKEDYLRSIKKDLIMRIEESVITEDWGGDFVLDEVLTMIEEYNYEV